MLIYRFDESGSLGYHHTHVDLDFITVSVLMHEKRQRSSHLEMLDSLIMVDDFLQSLCTGSVH